MTEWLITHWALLAEAFLEAASVPAVFYFWLWLELNLQKNLRGEQ